MKYPVPEGRDNSHPAHCTEITRPIFVVFFNNDVLLLYRTLRLENHLRFAFIGLCVVTHTAYTRVDRFDNYEIAVRRPFSKHMGGKVVMGAEACS
jgi:hypothetical protein